MTGQANWGRASLLAGLAALTAALITWQGVQGWKAGVIGVPGVLMLTLFEQARDWTDEDAPFAGGVTVVAKTRATVAKQTAPAAAPEPPALAAEPALPAGVATHSLGSVVVTRPPVSEPLTTGSVTATATSPALLARPLTWQDEGPALPSESDIRSWVRAEAEEAVGGVDEQGMPLYRFNVWLDAPDETRQKIASVAYNFDAPSAKPREQSSTEKQGGFRVKFGGASCARTVLVTVTLDDGRSQMADVDGCAILN